MTFGEYLESQKFANSHITLGEYNESQNLGYWNFDDDDNDFGPLPPYNRNFEKNSNSFQNFYNNEFKFKSDSNFQGSHFHASAPRPMTFGEGLRMYENERIENRYREENRSWEHELDLLFESDDDFAFETFEVEECFEPNEVLVPTLEQTKARMKMT